MSTQRMKADRYAQAILEAIVEQWQGTLSSVADALAQGNTLAALNDHSQELDGRLAQLGKLLPADSSAEIQNFLSMLVQEGDLNLLGAISGSLRSSLSGQTAPQEAEIVSAVELGEAEKDQLRQQLTAKHGDGLTFAFRVDASLLGGLRVRVGDSLIDHTVASRLTALREVIASTVR
ncbi:MAG: ATP synthase F1 subunit delta [Caldilineaceae bacterium]|nr:ATP synthase F1 subunit delta [Caldilineaceae bacterium]HRJ40344.1 ATP synthase F1 subunit delta [Caldilineaceae bacterium]